MLVQSVECVVQSVECVVQSVECVVQSIESVQLIHVYVMGGAVTAPCISTGSCTSFCSCSCGYSITLDNSFRCAATNGTTIYSSAIDDSGVGNVSCVPRVGDVVG